MKLVAVLLEPSLSAYTCVRLEFDDQSGRRVTFTGFSDALKFHEIAERLVQDRAAMDTCLAAARTHSGFVQTSDV